MNIAEYSRAGNPLIIEITEDIHRLAAEVFVCDRGIVFAESHWSDPQGSTHPIHVVEGELRADPGGFWRMFRYDAVQEIRPVTDHPFDGPFRAAWTDWLEDEYRRPREAAREFIVNSFWDLKEVSE